MSDEMPEPPNKRRERGRPETEDEYCKFPDDFDWEHLKNFEPEEDSSLLKMTRKDVCQIVKIAMTKGETCAVIAVRNLTHPERRRLVKELCERFPNRVSYRWASDALGVDRFEPIKDPKNPNISYEYKIDLKTTEQIK